MIVCPTCAHENVDGTQFCEMCGEELPAATPSAASAENLVKCPECGHENPAENMICEACGAELKTGAAATVAAPTLDTVATITAPPTPTAPVVAVVTPDSPATVTPDPAAPNTAATPATAPAVNQNLTPGSVKLVVEQGQTVGAQFVLGDPELLVGREDEDADIYPDIDLSDQDAGYVHRRHATLKFEDGALHVTHLGGANKTRVNNKPLADDTPTSLKLGDKIGFGKVVVRLLPV